MSLSCYRYLPIYKDIRNPFCHYTFKGSITKMDAEAKTKGNYAGGENVGGSWTDKIMGMKSSQPADASQTEGVDEDEWVCQFKQYSLC